jgi:hypothetical protein
LNESIVNNNDYEKTNFRDLSKFQNLYTLANNGSLNMFREQLNDYLKLSEEDIVTAFPSLKSEVKTGKIKERLTSYIKEIDKVEELYNKNKNKNLNPFDPSRYDPIKEPGMFREEQFRYKTFEHIRYLSIFTENSMIRAGERMIDLYSSLESMPVFRNMSANDLVLLTQDELILAEIDTLKDEIKLADDTGAKYEGLKSKRKKLENLQKIQEFLKEGRNKFGSIKPEKKEQMRKLFKKYVQDLATEKQSIIDNDLLDEQIEKIFDYNKLSEDEKMYNNSIIALSDPTKFDELFTATYQKRKEIFDNGAKIFRDSIYKHINNEIYRKVLNDLADEGYYLDPEEVIAFHESGYKDFSVITKIFDDKGLVEDVNIEKTLKKLLNDVMLKQEQEEKIIDDGKATIEDDLKVLMEEFELESYNVLSIEQDKIVTDLENKIFGNLKFNNPTETALALDKHKDDLSTIIDALLVVAESNSTIGAFDALQAFEFYINGQLEENQKQFLDRVFGKYDKTGEINKAFNTQLEEITDEEIEEIEEEEEEGAEETTEEEKERKRQARQREFPDLGIKIEIKSSKKSGLFILTSGGKKISQNYLMYFGLERSDTKFKSLQNAIDAMNALEVSADANQKMFILNNNVQLKPNQIVYDKDGKSYLVKSTLPQYLSEKKIYIQDGMTNRVEILEEQDFIDNYSTEKRTKSFPNKLSTVDNNVVLIPKAYQIDPTTGKRDANYVPLSSEIYGFVMSFFGKKYGKDEANLFKIDISARPTSDKLRPVQPNPNEDAHPHMFYKDLPYTIALSLTPEGMAVVNAELRDKNQKELTDPVISFINTNNIVFTDTNNSEINPLEMTMDQSKMFFENMDDAKYDRLIDNFASNKALEFGIKEYFANNNIASASFSEQEFIEQFDVDFIKAIQKFNYDPSNPISLDEVAFSKIQGQYFITRNVLDQDFNIVIDTEVPGNPEIDESLLNRIESASEEYKFQQGYIAWAFTPSGELVYIPLKSRTLNDTELQRKFQDIQEISKKVKNKEDVDLDKFNTEKDYFISMPRGFYLNVFVLEESGDVLLSLKKKSFDGQEVKTTYEQTLRLSSDNITSLRADTIQDFLNFFNESIEKQLDDTIAPNFKLSLDNFRVNFSKEATNDEIVENVKTDLQSTLYSQNNFKIQASTEAIEQIKNPPVNTSNNNDNNSDNENSNNPELDKEIEKINVRRQGAKDLVDTDKLAAVTRQSNIQNTKEGIENIIKFLNETFTFKHKLVEYDGSTLTLSRDGVEFGIPFSDVVLGGGALYSFDFDINDIIDAKYNAEISALSLDNVDEQFSKEDLIKKKKELESKLQDNINASKKLKRKLKKQTDQTAIDALSRQLQDLQVIYNEITSELTDIENDLNDIIGKVIDPSHTKYSVEDIDTFINWLKNNLPDFIRVDDIDTLRDNMLRGGKRVGGFMMDIRRIAGKIKSGGVIFTKDANPGKYHEAFHAVFRLLLSDAEISKYLQIAEKEVRAKLRLEGKTLEQELELFKNVDVRFDSYSKKELKERYLEEYMADEFDLFKSNPRSTKTDSFIKSLFNRIIEIIKNILTFFKRSDNVAYNSLNELFIAIDSGKYKSANLMDNRFTEVYSPGTSEIINTLVPYMEFNGITKYLDSDTSDALVGQLYARVLTQQELRPTESLDDLMDESIEKFLDLYEMQVDELEENNENKSKIDRYNNVLTALEDYSDEIKSNIYDRLKYINLTQENIDSIEEETLYEVGENTSNFGLKQEMIGAEKSMPNFVRKYIASTTMVKKDMFGNEFLTKDTVDANGKIIKGEKIVSTPNIQESYNGLLRATSDVFNHSEMLTKLVMYTETSNFETKGKKV